MSTGGEQGRERPGQKQTGLAQHAPLLGRIGSAMQQRAMSPVPLPVAPPPLFLTLRNKDPHSLRTFFTGESPSPTSLALGPSGAWTVWSREGTEKIWPSYPVVHHINQDKELPATPPPQTGTSGGGPRDACSPPSPALRNQDLQRPGQGTGVLLLRKVPTTWPSLEVVPSPPGRPKRRGNDLGATGGLKRVICFVHGISLVPHSQAHTSTHRGL